MSDLRRYFGEKWDADDATEKLYLTHDLTEDSVVFDVGGYEGEWSAEIVSRYHSRVYIFEPVPDFFTCIMSRFMGSRERIHVLKYGLASRDDYLPVAVCGPASGLLAENREQEQVVRFRQAATAAMEVLHVQNVGDIHIDLMAINIEGGEYDLLRHMITSGLASRCREIMVQFHMLWPECFDRWKEISRDLQETHEIGFEYPFVWSKYRRRA